MIWQLQASTDDSQRSHARCNQTSSSLIFVSLIFFLAQWTTHSRFSLSLFLMWSDSTSSLKKFLLLFSQFHILSLATLSWNCSEKQTKPAQQFSMEAYRPLKHVHKPWWKRITFKVISCFRRLVLFKISFFSFSLIYSFTLTHCTCTYRDKDYNLIRYHFYYYDSNNNITGLHKTRKLKYILVKEPLPSYRTNS